MVNLVIYGLLALAGVLGYFLAGNGWGAVLGIIGAIIVILVLILTFIHGMNELLGGGRGRQK